MAQPWRPHPPTHCPAQPPDEAGETGDDGYASVGGTSAASLRAWLRHMREFTYQVGGEEAGQRGGDYGSRSAGQACFSTAVSLGAGRLGLQPPTATCAASPPLLVLPPQTVGLLPTHCPPAMDSPTLQAAHAQSAYAYVDVRLGVGWEGMGVQVVQ